MIRRFCADVKRQKGKGHQMAGSNSPQKAYAWNLKMQHKGANLMRSGPSQYGPSRASFQDVGTFERFGFCRTALHESHQGRIRSRMIPRQLCMFKHVLQCQHKLIYRNITPCDQHSQFCHHPIWEVGVPITLKTQKIKQLCISDHFRLKA